MELSPLSIEVQPPDHSLILQGGAFRLHTWGETGRLLSHSAGKNRSFKSDRSIIIYYIGRIKDTHTIYIGENEGRLATYMVGDRHLHTYM